MNLPLIIHGGDRRNIYLAQILQSMQLEVYLWRAPECPEGILSLPDAKLAQTACALVLSPATPPEKLMEALMLLRSGSSVYTGRIDDVCRKVAAEHHIQLFSFLDDEAMTLQNAIPTAEGALELAMRHTARTIDGAPTLVLGYGRVGKATARLFAAAGAKVTVLARSRADRAHAQINALPAKHLDTLAATAKDALIILNTIPHMVLPEPIIRLLLPDCLLIDLASGKGGIDFDAARARGLQALHALALPGIHAPQTAAQYMAESLLNTLQESEA